MLFLGKIALYIAGITAGIVILIPIICMVDFVLKNALYLSEIIVDSALDGLNKLSQIFKRKHKK